VRPVTATGGGHARWQTGFHTSSLAVKFDQKKKQMTTIKDGKSNELDIDQLIIKDAKSNELDIDQLIRFLTSKSAYPSLSSRLSRDAILSVVDVEPVDREVSVMISSISKIF
jgi:hypothetical protein